MANYALHANATFFEHTVEETFTSIGRDVVFGEGGDLALPMPAGTPYVAKAKWLGPTTVQITDYAGRVAKISQDGAVEVVCGDVVLKLSLVRRAWLPRFGPLAWGLSLGWFTTVFAASVSASVYGSAAGVIAERQCEILERLAPHSESAAARFAASCVQQGQSSAEDWTAEYLSRLLKKDYAGEDSAVVEKKDVPAEKKVQSVYMPAGSTGPATEMGGAENVAPEPIRTQGEGETAAAPAEAAPAVVAEKGPPVASLNDANKKEVGVEARQSDKAATEDNESGPAEEKQGWGVKDWYDAEDERLDKLEISQTLLLAKRRLRIDPNDPSALQVLSYYQYLGEDFEGAIATYDKFISLYPEEASGYNNKALVYKRKGDWTTEEALYRQALLIEPDDVTALNNLAVNLSHQHRFDEAIAILNKLEALDPGEPYTDLHRAKVYAEMGEDDRACAFLEKALQGMAKLDTLHHIEFRQDIRVDPSFAKLRETPRFNAILTRYYGKDSPLQQ